MVPKTARRPPLVRAAACFNAAKICSFGMASLLSLLAISSTNACLAEPKVKSRPSKSESDPNYVAPTLEYDEILDPGKKRPISSLVGAEMALRSERVDRSIQLARRAMQRNPDDMDVHKALAEALDRKLEHQIDKDPQMFAECVREWLIVMRNGVGLEKGTNFHGIGIFDSLYGDDEYYGEAKLRLKHLTGYVPKPWESNEKFLKRVLKPAQTELKGKILRKSD